MNMSIANAIIEINRRDAGLVDNVTIRKDGLHVDLYGDWATPLYATDLQDRVCIWTCMDKTNEPGVGHVYVDKDSIDTIVLDADPTIGSKWITIILK